MQGLHGTVKIHTPPNKVSNMIVHDACPTAYFCPMRYDIDLPRRVVHADGPRTARGRPADGPRTARERTSLPCQTVAHGLPHKSVKETPSGYETHAVYADGPRTARGRPADGPNTPDSRGHGLSIATVPINPRNS